MPCPTFSSEASVLKEQRDVSPDYSSPGIGAFRNFCSVLQSIATERNSMTERIDQFEEFRVQCTAITEVTAGTLQS